MYKSYDLTLEHSKIVQQGTRRSKPSGISRPPSKFLPRGGRPIDNKFEKRTDKTERKPSFKGKRDKSPRKTNLPDNKRKAYTID